MASRSRLALRTARVCACLLALSSGAALAHLTSSAPSAEAAAPHPQPATATPQGAPKRPAASLEAGRPAPSAAASLATQNAESESALSHQTLHEAYRDGRIIDGATPNRLILFTFDDGPDRRTTPLLLDRLDAVGVKAVFFLTAGRVAGRSSAERDQAELAREIVARGHLIGSHTVDHAQLPLLDDASASDQVDRAQAILERVTGVRTPLFRPPGGARSARIDELLASRGYTTVLWNLGAGDFQVHSAEQVLQTFRRVLERRERENGERGGIVLLHDTYSWSVDAFQMIWADLWARNCKLLERGEELYDIVSDLTFFHQPRAGAPAAALAVPAVLPEQVLRERQARLRAEAQTRCRSADGF